MRTKNISISDEPSPTSLTFPKCSVTSFDTTSFSYSSSTDTISTTQNDLTLNHIPEFSIISKTAIPNSNMAPIEIAKEATESQIFIDNLTSEPVHFESNIVVNNVKHFEDGTIVNSFSSHQKLMEPNLADNNLKPSLSNESDFFEALKVIFHNLYMKYSGLPFLRERNYALVVLFISYFILPYRRQQPKKYHVKFKKFLVFISGFLFGVYASLILFVTYYISDPEAETPKIKKQQEQLKELREESIKEDAVQTTFEGWMNILNEPYNINIFQYNRIQPVLVKLEGNLLTVMRPEKNMLKHAICDDPTFKEKDPTIITTSIYNLTDAEVKLRPKRLAKNRWYSRRYPISITLASPECETHTRNEKEFLKLQQEAFESERKKRHRNPIHKVKKIIKNQMHHTQRDSSSSSSDDEDYFTPQIRNLFTRQISEVIVGSNQSNLQSDFKSNENFGSLQRSLSEGSLVSSPLHRLQRSFPGPKSPASRNVYLFARTAREKERWFHVLRKACTKFNSNYSAMITLENSKHFTTPSLPAFNRDYYLYLIKEMEFNRLLSNILPNANDNRSETSSNYPLGINTKNSVIMDLGKQPWNQPAHLATSDLVVVSNLLTTRIFYDLSKDYGWIDLIRQKVQTKIATVHLPHFMEELVLTEIDMGTEVPKVTKIFSPSVDDWGIWLDVEIFYEGSMKLTMETRCDLLKLQSNPDPTLMAPATDGPWACRMLSMRNTPNKYYDEDIPLSPEMSPDEDFGTKIEVRSKKRTGKKKVRKLLGLMDRVVHSKLAKKVTEIKPVRKTIQKISAQTITINVEITYVSGIMAINIPSPPSDRVWYGFRQPPEMKVKTVPQIGDHTIDFSKLSDFMESSVKLLMKRHVVLPNMDDLVIPTITGDPLLNHQLNM